MKNNYTITTIGLVLFLSYLLQETFLLKWNFLENLQVQENYKRWSGLVLGLFILFQWLLTFSRIIPKFRAKSVSINNLHKWIGVFSPILLYAHSTKFGFGYLVIFSYLFLINMLIGTLNLDVLKSTKSWLFKGWMITHVALSMCITLFLNFHIYIVFYYK
ncbi:hypothetical protein [Flavicella sediminum]|uniref:hypothetical protein n=1 Tax=Flavicella sediminum TaxID=2585141 RepID=UPI00111D488B|nr:hypothetical protein [Flavicella sediminum]